MPSYAATNCEFTERSVMAVSLQDFPESVIVVLSHDRRARRDHKPAFQEHLPNCADVETLCVQRFGIRGIGSGEEPSFHRATVAIFKRRTGRREEGSTIAAIPEHPRPHHGTCVSRQVRPPIVIHVRTLVPVAATQQ
jgi:hypothetical protein